MLNNKSVAFKASRRAMCTKAGLIAAACIAGIAVLSLFSSNACALSLYCIFGLTFVCLLLAAFSRVYFPAVRRGTVGFFHPHAEDGGGGERVLWSAVKALRNSHPGLKVIVFTGPGFTAGELLDRAKRNFNLQIDPSIEVIPLRHVSWMQSELYPRFTLLCQGLASFCVAWMGLHCNVPEIFVDTSGWSFSYPLAWWLGCKVVSYVHYPTISQDMLSRIQSRATLYNNHPQIAKSRLLSFAKQIYYHAFALWYGFTGGFASVVMVNSKWTENHIRHLWRKHRQPRIVYPPVDTISLQELPLDRSSETNTLISVAQFRPEKNHALQIQAYAKALEDAARNEQDPVRLSKLKIIGSCRNKEDRDRLENLKHMVREYNLERHVEFFENIPYIELKQLLGEAVAGLHTMIDEHFGIGIVEYMAAGVIPIAHNSGGPKLDILSHRHGYLRTTLDEYSNAISEVLRLEKTERRTMAQQCRERADLFSQERFEREFLTAVEPLLPPDDGAPGI